MSYVPVDAVEVYAWGHLVGAVAPDPATPFYVFEYAPSWAGGDRELSPLHMRNRRAPYVFPNLAPATYYRLPALLADALPDDFGNALVDAYLAAQGVDRQAITSLDRLAYQASRGLGALEFRPSRGPRHTKATAIDLGELVTAARSAIRGGFAGDGHISTVLSHLIQVGTSAGGARAKAVLAWSPTTGAIRSGQVPAAPGFEHWMVKLDGVGRDNELGGGAGYGRIEYAYHLMARAAGIEMTPCRLLEEDGRAHFMTRRFDRVGGSKVHMQTLCGLAHLDFRLIGAHSYESYLATVDELGLPVDARTEAFRRMAFNVAAANCDDHTKNVSFLLPEDDGWRLSPAYDVTHAFNPVGTWTYQHLMSVNGRFAGITRHDVMEVADRFAVPAARDAYAQVLAAVDRWPEFAAAAGLADEELRRVGADIADHSAPLR